MNRIEKIGFAAAISSDDDVMLRTEWLDFALVPEAAEARDDNLLDMHLVFCSKCNRGNL